MSESLDIVGLGQQGDGIASRDGERLHVPYALPGERVTVEVAGDRAALVAVDTPSLARRAPECGYFGRCGGCAAQHMDEPLYRAWKRDQAQATVSRGDVEAPLGELEDAHGEGRRRVTFHLRLVDGALRAGLMAARSHDLVAIDRCPITVPALKGAAKAAEAVGRLLQRKGKPLDVQATATLGGLDLDIRGHGPVSERDRAALVRAADALDLARLAIHGEVVVARRDAGIPMGRAVVVPPAGGFLQATGLGEETLARHVTDAVGKAKRVADLFAGCGPFALRLAETATVHAVEADAAALLSLDRAVRATPGLRGVSTETRDLFRRPLLRGELECFDAVVLDPPRAGAEAQSRQLAGSKVPLVVMVSCDARSFASDAAILVAGGYAIEAVTPVDQFRYSHHIELVGVLRRPTTGRIRR